MSSESLFESGNKSLLKKFCVSPAELNEHDVKVLTPAAPFLIDSLEGQIEVYCTKLKVSKSTPKKVK